MSEGSLFIIYAAVRTASPPITFWNFPLKEKCSGGASAYFSSLPLHSVRDYTHEDS